MTSVASLSLLNLGQPRTRHNRSVTKLPLLTFALAGTLVAAQAQDPPPKFKAGVAIVPVAAVVRDSGKRLVRDLTRDDFQVLEDGVPRTIVDFRSTDQAPISIALLLDTSSSMRDANQKQASLVAEAVLKGLGAGDEAALFTFDKNLRQETPFTNDDQVIQAALAKAVMWGQTSLYDAVGETAKRLSEQQAPRRAVVVITDGVDTSSARTAGRRVDPRQFGRRARSTWSRWRRSGAGSAAAMPV